MYGDHRALHVPTPSFPTRRPSVLKLDGLQLLDEIKLRDPTLPVLMISGHGNLDTAVAAIRQGAVDFIEKPFEAGHLLHLVSRATETDRLRRENESLRQQIVHDEVLSGASVAINSVRATLKRVAPTGSRVLLTGQLGRAACRERVCQYGSITVVAGSLKK